MDRSFNDGMDYSGDGAAAAGSFFSSDFKKHDDLKQMLDSNRDNLKLEAMKRIIGMVAKGRDASELFPAVVKNVVSKNTEVKKLVYVYLVRYAEEQQDLALLSISTFQRALKDPNQLIRASALRVLSSIRVPVIVPIVMLAIRESAADMSPYVRKTAAHAIPKLYNLDADQKEELIQILEKLLGDRTTLVVGSAVMAFEELCPDRIDLIHKNYRKLCTLLVDVDEWGQVVIVNMLTRYARTQFLDPNIGDVTIDGESKPFYEDDDKDESDDSHKKEKGLPKPQMDPDHRLLLKNAKPLLQSRNSAVVLAVVQLYHHLAPKTEAHVVIKPLIRLLRSHPEIQVVVLTCMAAMSTNRKSLFESYMKSFFVRSSDPTQVKLLKLEILTNIANQTNIPPILREFQTYISSQDKQFVAATIEAIGRCASNIKEVAETCLNGLVSLLSHPDPSVVGGAVVVSKTLLQTHKGGKKAVITQLAKMVDRVTVPRARAAILWLLGEHAERIPHLPPDVLRKMAKTFSDEEDIVKLQIINLAAKLQLTNPTQTSLLCQYILNLAKYDQSYDIRDKARFMRQLLFPDNPDSKLSKCAKKILLASKPAPILQSKFKDRDHFQLGSLSHYMNTRAAGYHDLADFPTVAPDPSVRDVELPYPYSPEKTLVETKQKSTKMSKKKVGKEDSKTQSFYSDEDEDVDLDSNDESDTSEDSESDSSSETEKSESASSEENVKEGSEKSASGSKSDSSTDDAKKHSKTKLKERKVVRYVEALSKVKSQSSESGNALSSSSSSSDSDSSDPESNTTDSDNAKPKSKGAAKKSTEKKPSSENAKIKSQKKVKSKDNSNVGFLLDLDFEQNENGTSEQPSSQSIASSFDGLVLSPTVGSVNALAVTGTNATFLGTIQPASAVFIPTKQSELLNRIASGGLQIMSRFTRAPHLFSPSMVSIELQFANSAKEPLKNIRIGEKALPNGMTVHDFETIESLDVGKSITCTLGVDFNDTTQGLKIEIQWTTETGVKKQMITLNAPLGEQVRPVSIPESLFIAEQAKLRGMTEHETKIFINTSLSSCNLLAQKVYEVENLLQVPSMEDDLVRFAGQSLSSKTLVLVSIKLLKNPENEARIVVNCEKMVLGSILLQELKLALK